MLFFCESALEVQHADTRAAPNKIKNKRPAFTHAVCSEIMFFKADVAEYVHGIGELEQARDVKPSHPHQMRCEV